MKKNLLLVIFVFATACASTPSPTESPPLTAAIENTRATEKLMTDPKFQEGLDVAMASGSTLEPFVRDLAAVPATDESRVLMNALLEEESKRRPLTAPPLMVPQLQEDLYTIEPTPVAASRTSTGSGFWNENRVVGALLGVIVLGLVMSRTDYKLVITAP